VVRKACPVGFFDRVERSGQVEDVWERLEFDSRSSGCGQRSSCQRDDEGRIEVAHIAMKRVEVLR
jgi:hypothetical protein